MSEPGVDDALLARVEDYFSEPKFTSAVRKPQTPSFRGHSRSTAQLLLLLHWSQIREWMGSHGADFVHLSLDEEQPLKNVELCMCSAKLLTPNVAQLFEPSTIIDVDLSLVLVMVLVSSVNSYGAMISSQVEGVCVYV
jgi:hypothetical protein